MTETVTIDQLVAKWAGGTETISVDDSRIAEVLGAVGLGGAQGRRVEEIIRQVLSDLVDEPLSMRVGNWQVDMPATVFRSGITAALMIGAIEAVGINSTAVVVLAAVVPFLVDVERVTISPSERLVLAGLTANLTSVQDRRALWENLPADLQHELTFLEFVDLLDRLSKAGVIRAVGEDRYALPPGRGVFHGRLR